LPSDESGRFRIIFIALNSLAAQSQGLNLETGSFDTGVQLERRRVRIRQI